MTSYKRIALVTGASSGIGAAIVRKLVQEGYGVIGNARTASKLEQMKAALGDAFHPVAGDTADQATIDQCFADAGRVFGRSLTTVVINAGVGLGGTVSSADLSRFDELLRTNVGGPARLLQACTKHFVPLQKDAFPKEAADVVVVGSVAGRNISPFSAVYGSTKFAVHSLAEAARRELGPKGVRVALVEPGFVISGFQATSGYSEDMVEGLMDRCGPTPSPDELATAVHFILSLPPHVNISDIVIRPTRQEFP